MKSFTFYDETTGFTATLTVTENTDGTLSVVLDVDESTGVTGDVRALYLNNSNDDFYSGLAVAVAETDGDASTTSDTDIALSRQEIDKVRWVESKDTNINGEVIHENEGAFDTGLEFGTQGISGDDVQHMEFILSADDALTIDSFDWSTLGLRVTSVGDVDGSRDGSLKLTGTEDPPPPPPASTVVANHDDGFVNEADLFDGPGVQVSSWFGGFVDWETNDFDPEGDSFHLLELNGANGTSSGAADMDGWFGWVDGTMGGEVRLNLDGRVEIRADALGQIFETLTTTVEYTIEDATGATSSAMVLIDVEAGD